MLSLVAEEHDARFGVVEPEYNADNGAMIAIAGCYNRKKIIDWQNLSADSNLRLGE
jgi:tRNA A37 threonylcarbamoyltransferase TsaD